MPASGGRVGAVDGSGAAGTASDDGATWLIDAYNVIGARPDGWWRDRMLALARLCDAVAEWLAPDDAAVVVVDGWPRPEVPEGRPKGPAVSTADGSIAAMIANSACRLLLLRAPEGEAYAIAETWNGAGWQRVGSIYPLIELKLDADEESSSAMQDFLYEQALRNKKCSPTMYLPPAQGGVAEDLQYMVHDFIQRSIASGGVDPAKIIKAQEKYDEALAEYEAPANYLKSCKKLAEAVDALKD